MYAQWTPRGVSGGVNNSVPFSAANDARRSVRRGGAGRAKYVRHGGCLKFMFVGDKSVF